MSRRSSATAPAVVTVMTTLLLSATGGCSSGPSRDRDETETVTARDREAAVRHVAAACRMIDADRAEAAATELERALDDDPLSGAAHNNLGVLRLEEGDTLAAARHFERAAGLLRDRIEPVNNLGMVYESLGMLESAEEQYRRALRRDPESIEVTGNLARTLVRRGTDNDELRELLTRLSAEDTRPEWSRWATLRLNATGKTERPNSP